MTELDFDELDKAVNDLMKDVETPTEVTQAAGESQGEQRVQDTAVETAQPQPVLAANTNDSTLPPAVKSRGKFMDVVAPVAKKPLTDGLVAHGQSAVTQQPGVANNTIADIMPGSFAPRSFSQSGSPAGDEAQSPSVSDQPGPVASDNTGADDSAPRDESQEPYAPNPAPVQEWPESHSVSDLGNDHLGDDDTSADLPASTAPQVEASDAPEQAGGTPAIATESEQSTSDAQPQPQETELTTVVQPDEPQPDTSASSPLPQSVMTSPFLPGAKVEKRPLGGETPAAGAEAPNDATPEPLPREYGPDLLSLESDTSAEQAMNAAQTAASAEPVGTPAAPAATQPAPAPATTIFDTDTYHTPLKQPAKAKSGWLTLIWILALLIIGAVAGAAYYFYTIQH